ncbi:lantibiotic dehydratase [Streptacidiphilus anmyonensis]|uniref:lantibiotic dehydratase n=1 Tax=Streptacidiphilus anmyonensis TaxID=405782 RepID=UPI0005AB21EB|nr:lantibiotic dehydratase [Streptacidiphilus anmyonensis]
MTEIRLPGGRWRLWEQFALRGPGFPADGVLRLAPAGLAEAADKFGPGDALTGPDWDAFAEGFDEAAVATAYALQDIARTPAFREAVAWQNRPVLDSGIKPFLNWTPTAAGRTSMPRQREELVAHYWQRFCVKNDTIGFFGPVGWGRFDGEAGAGVRVDPGEGLVAATELYFAGWAVDALAANLAADPAVREWTAPRRVPFVRAVGEEVLVPGRPPQQAGAELTAVLARCDGVRTARRIAEELPELDVAALLDELVRRRWAVWRLEVPAATRPERWLRAWLDTVGDFGVRERGLHGLELLERGRERVRSARGADQVVAAMSLLEREFVELTETAAVREKSAGTAPCRALVYSDCRRSATASIGAEVGAVVAASLEPLFTAAGWLTSRLAAEVMDAAKGVHARLAAQGPVNLASFWFACMPILHGDARRLAQRLQQEFQAHWQAILDPEPGVRRVRRGLAEVAAAVAERFAVADGPGWTAARYLSPDVMIAARGVDAIERGEFQLVLGELHLASNTLGASLFVHQHADPAELAALTERDHPGPRLAPLLPKEHRSRLSARVKYALRRPEDYQVALVDQTGDPADPRTLLSADVAVVERDGALRVVLPDGAEFPAVDVFAHVLTTLAMDLFQILPEAEHTPRVTVDRLVVARETWRLPAASLGFPEEKDERRRFVRARRWREQQGLPRFVFVVSPTESRPFYVDFDSPVYVTVLAKAMRRLARKDPDGRVVITEMLPTPEQTWLTDAAGHTYTSELRFVAVDERDVAGGDA